MKQVLETYVANRTTPCIFRTNLYTKMYNFNNIFILKEAISAVKMYIIDEHFLYDTHYHANATTHGKHPNCTVWCVLKHRHYPKFWFLSSSRADNTGKEWIIQARPDIKHYLVWLGPAWVTHHLGTDAVGIQNSGKILFAFILDDRTTCTARNKLRYPNTDGYSLRVKFCHTVVLFGM